MMWGTSTTQSSPRTDWKLIDISPKIEKWYTHPVLISSICEKTNRKQKQCCAFHPSSLMMWGTSTTQSSPRAELTLIDITPNLKQIYTHPVLISSICEQQKKNGAVHSTIREEPQQPRAHREQIENSSTSSRTLNNYTFIQFSYRQYA